jgi:hypothetical protein
MFSNFNVGHNKLKMQINKEIIVNNSNSILPYNVADIKRRGIRVINNVYQPKYKFGIASTGLGDFIRGSYFILDFCFKYKFKPKIIFNNCISKFLKIKTNGLNKINYLLNQILSFPNGNFMEFLITNDGTILEPTKDIRRIMYDYVEYLSLIPVHNHNVFGYCISYPMRPVSDLAKRYMRSILEPSDEMKLIIHNILINNFQFKYRDYTVIHIRSGDVYLNKNSSVFKKEYISKLLSYIDAIVDREKNYLIISDNNEIKNFVLEKFTNINIKTLFKEITHFGEGVVLEEEKVKNTMIDFYLLSLSSAIFSYSCYKHGSGFSYWCAQTYNIPYVCKYIN